jgi:hypothetical protein
MFFFGLDGVRTVETQPEPTTARESTPEHEDMTAPSASVGNGDYVSYHLVYLGGVAHITNSAYSAKAQLRSYAVVSPALQEP